MAEAVATGQPLDPSSPDDRAALDAFFGDDLTPALATLDPAERVRQEDALIARIGVTPRAVALAIRAGLLSTDPAAQLAAARRLTTLDAIDPTLADAIPSDERARATTLAGLADLPLPPARLSEIAERKLAAQQAAQPPAPTPDAGAPDGGATGFEPEIRDTDPLTPEQAAFAQALIEGGMEPDKAIDQALDRQFAEGEVIPIDGVETENLQRVADDGMAELDRRAAEKFAGTALDPARDEPAETDAKPRDEPRDPIAAALGVPDAMVTFFEFLPVTGQLIGATRTGTALNEARKAYDRGDMEAAREHLGEALLEGGATMAGPFGRAVRKAQKALGAARKGRRGGSDVEGVTKAGRARPANTGAIKQQIEREARRPGRVDVKPIDPGRANKEFVEEMKSRTGHKPGDSEPHPPHRPDTPAFEYTTGPEGEEFVRFIGKKGKAMGQWVMRAADVKGLSPAQIKDKFAIEDELVSIVRVKLPPGQKMRFSAANPHPVWGSGNGTQFQIPGELNERWFGKPRRIKP